MNHLAFASIINFLASIISLLIITVKGPRNILSLLWGLLSLTVGLWAFALFSAYYLFEGSGANMLKALAFANTIAIFIPILFYHFSCSFVGYKSKLLKYFYWAGFTVLALAIFNFKDYIVAVDIVLPGLEYPVAGKYFHFFPILFALAVVFGIRVLLKAYKGSVGLRRNQLKYLIAGLAIGFGGGSTTFFPIYGIDVYPYGVYLVPFYVLTVAIAIVRYKLMDIRLAVTKAGVFIIGCLPFLAVPFIVGHKTQEWFLSTCLAIVLATLGPMVYRFVEGKAEERLLSEQRHYQSTLMQAARGMVKIRDIKRLMNLITHICSKAVRTKHAHFFMYDQLSDEFCLSSSRYRDDSLLGFRMAKNHPLVVILNKRRGPIVLEELFHDSDLKMSFSDRQQLDNFSKKFGVALLVPSISDGRISAFLTLGLKARGRIYTDDDINVFNTLAHQAALAIENCQFMEDFKKAQEKVFNAEKLATLGAMASGLSHQLNNRLQAFAAISADLIDAADFMLKGNDLPEAVVREMNYMQNGLKGIEDNVEHSAQIIRGVLDYARTEKDTSFKPLDIVEVITPSIGLLKVKHNTKDLNIHIDLNTKDVKVFGSVALLSEAVFNLVDNAYEAILQREDLFNYEKRNNPPKNLKIRTQKSDDKVIVVVSDNGIGIKKDDNAKMYAPFFTTKSSTKSGTGLGMYVIKRIIEEDHKGKLWYESEYLKGTDFYLELPTKAR